MTAPTPMTARVNGTPGTVKGERLVMVADPDAGNIPVRWRSQPENSNADPWIWSCRIHGHQTEVECVHTFYAALHLAGTLLGLTRAEPPTDPTPAAEAAASRTERTAS